MTVEHTTLKILGLFDHTLLNPYPSPAEIETFREELESWPFWGGCTFPWIIEYLGNRWPKNKKKITVVNFPLGHQPISKVNEEVRYALDWGVDEIDLVIPFYLLSLGDHETFVKEINAIKKVMADKTLKLIVEWTALSDDQKEMVMGLCLKTDADFIKSGTGFRGPGISIPEVEKMCRLNQGTKKIKISGGIKTWEQVEEILKFKVDRLGLSRGAVLVQDKLKIGPETRSFPISSY